jgi:hypothetical protein
MDADRLWCENLLKSTAWKTQKDMGKLYYATGCEDVRYDGVSKSFRTGRLERELQMVQLSATKCSCIAIL